MTEAEECNVVLLRWQQGKITQSRLFAMNVRPESVDEAIEMLRNDCVAWVRPEDAEAVLAGVYGAE